MFKLFVDEKVVLECVECSVKRFMVKKFRLFEVDFLNVLESFK